MHFYSLPVRLTKALLTLSMALLFALPTLANDHGGGGGGASPLVFTVNLGASAYLQIGVILEPATPEVGHELEVFRPKIQHEIIMLLSGHDEGKLRTLKGKHVLLDEILETVNHVIHEDEQTGVKEILISSFIIQ